MKKRKDFFPLALAFILFVVLIFPASADAQRKKITVTNMTTPFGTGIYTFGTAFEEVFKKVNSWVDLKVQETPGAMYIAKYMYENKAKIDSGEINQVIYSTSSATVGHTSEGRPPFDKNPNPFNRAIFSSPSYIVGFTTFDPKIKSMRDLVGKKVGIPEKSRPFQSTLALKPYFEKGLGIWDKVGWQYLGAGNSKDALLNNKTDAHFSTMWGKVEKAPDGSLVCSEMDPYPPTFELLNSGRKLYFIPWEPDVIKRSFDFNTDMMVFPVLVRKGACQGIDQDMWMRGSLGISLGMESLPDDVLQEIIRVRHEYRKELAKYHATLKYFPDNPYPVGVPQKWLHSGLEKAMKNLGLPVPKE